MLIELPLPPKQLQPNRKKRLHWAVVRKATKSYREQVFACAHNHRPDKPLKRAKVQCTFYNRTAHKQDGDNALASLKAAFDGLVDAGIFEDDNQLEHLPPKQYKDKDNPRVVVEVKPT